MEVTQIYIPKWLGECLINRDNVSREEIFTLAEQKYKRFSFDERRLFNFYLNDLIEEGIIFQSGSFIYKNNDIFQTAQVGLN